MVNKKKTELSCYHSKNRFSLTIMQSKKILKLMFYILFCANLFVILQYELYSIMAAACCRV